MTNQPSQVHREGSDDTPQEATENNRLADAPPHVYPVPGVVMFTGAYVGGELAEERWR